VYVHPFAEEMNKSRRMAALASRALAAQGFAVLQVDLQGCGDSDGEFGDASWDAWVTDVLAGANWLQQRHAASLWLWGLRAGALVANAAAARMNKPPSLLLWQPATQGKTVLQQFLRLKMAAGLAAGSGKGVVDDLRNSLASGQAVEVAGYELTPALAAGLEGAVLRPLPGTPTVVWLEAANRANPDLLPVSRTAVEGWRAVDVPVDTSAVTGPPFWQTTEVEDAPALIAATIEALLHPFGASGAAERLRT
jgi:exosortase A-associated hydrolase 2